MQWLYDFFHNPFLIAPLASWAMAQIIKTLVDAIVNRKLDWVRLWGDGGMPSAHSATVSALCVSALLVYGIGSFQFALSFIFAIVVCRDAVGVRREAGKQAVLLQEMMKMVEDFTNEDLPDVKLKKLVGHTPLQVIAGILLGSAVAVALYFVFRNAGFLATYLAA